MAGAGGIEPPNVGTKNRCLTAWRRPNLGEPGKPIEEHSEKQAPLEGFQVVFWGRKTGVFGVLWTFRGRIRKFSLD